MVVDNMMWMNIEQSHCFMSAPINPRPAGYSAERTPLGGRCCPLSISRTDGRRKTSKTANEKALNNTNLGVLAIRNFILNYSSYLQITSPKCFLATQHVVFMSIPVE